MPLQTEHRGFTIGRQVGGCGRCTRFVLGLLGLAYIGTSVAQLGPSAALIERLAGGLLLTTALYLGLFWLLGERIPHPWLRTVIFWLPAAFILLPIGLRAFVALPRVVASLFGPVFPGSARARRRRRAVVVR